MGDHPDAELIAPLIEAGVGPPSQLVFDRNRWLVVLLGKKLLTKREADQAIAALRFSFPNATAASALYPKPMFRRWSIGMTADRVFDVAFADTAIELSGNSAIGW